MQHAAEGQTPAAPNYLDSAILPWEEHSFRVPPSRLECQTAAEWEAGESLKPGRMLTFDSSAAGLRNSLFAEIRH